MFSRRSRPAQPNYRLFAPYLGGLYPALVELGETSLHDCCYDFSEGPDEAYEDLLSERPDVAVRLALEVEELLDEWDEPGLMGMLEALPYHYSLKEAGITAVAHLRHVADMARAHRPQVDPEFEDLIGRRIIAASVEAPYWVQIGPWRATLTSGTGGGGLRIRGTTQQPSDQAPWLAHAVGDRVIHVDADRGQLEIVTRHSQFCSLPGDVPTYTIERCTGGERWP